MFNPTPGRTEDDPPQTSSSPKKQAAPNFVQPDPSINDDAYTFALERLLARVKPVEIRKSLIDAGYSMPQADKILQVANTYRKQAEQSGPLTVLGFSAGQLALSGIAICFLSGFIRVGMRPGFPFSVLILLADVVGVAAIITAIVLFVKGRSRRK